MPILPRTLVLACALATSLGPLGCTLEALGGSGGSSTGMSTSSSSSDVGGTTDTGVGGSTSSSGGFTAPQVVDFGGPVLASPKAVAITYDTDALEPSIDAFVAAVGSSSYWTQTTAEYGVGPLQARPPIHLSGPAPATITDQAIVQELKLNIGGANPAWGPADTNTNYVFVFPPGSIVMSDGEPCCGPTYDAYHGEAFAGGVSVSYSVVCECAGYDGPAFDVLQSTTAAISHELVESATDPFVDSNPAFTQTDDPHAAWTLATGGETADLCQYLTDWNVEPADLGFTVQRTWSNAAAAAGHDPCVPADPNTPYFVGVPIMSDAVTVDYYGTPWTTQGVQIPVGSSKAVPVRLYSDGPTSGPFTVQAFDVGATGTDLSFAWDKTTGTNGDELTLTITVMSADASLKGEPFSILSTSNGRSSIWYGVVGN